MSEETASQSVDAQPSDQPAEERKEEITAHMEAFGLEPEKEPERKDGRGGEEDEETTEESKKEEPPEESPAKETYRVKFNKEEIEIEPDKVPELLQKGLALDKERQRKSELEQALERAAKLAGFDSHEDYLKNLDKIEQERKQKEQDQFESLKNQLREEAEYAGLDPDKMEQYLDNHPLLKQAQQAIQEREKLEQAQKQLEQQQDQERKWNQLFEKYPDLPNSIQDDGSAPWMTDDMMNRIQRGYDPIDAYELAHRDTLFQQTKKQAEQEAIKQQKLNKRAAIETDKGTGKPEDEVPDNIAAVAKAFGEPIKSVKRFIKKAR